MPYIVKTGETRKAVATFAGLQNIAYGHQVIDRINQDGGSVTIPDGPVIHVERVTTLAIAQAVGDRTLAKWSEWQLTDGQVIDAYNAKEA